MKNTISIILLLTLLVYTSGGFIVFKYLQFQQRQAIKIFLKANPNTILITQVNLLITDIQHNKLDFSWEKDGTEFELNGEMYDVISVTKSKDSIHFLTLKDVVENKLMVNFASLFKNQTNKNSNTNSLLKLFTSDYIQTYLPKIVYLQNSIIAHTALYHSTPTTIFFDVIVPPPQI